MSDLTDLTADEVQAIANQLSHFASTYADIAKEMRENSFTTIKVKGIATLGYAMERIVGSVGSAQKALASKRNPAKDKLAFLRSKKSVEDEADELKSGLADRHVAAGGNAKKPTGTKKKKA